MPLICFKRRPVGLSFFLLAVFLFLGNFCALAQNNIGEDNTQASAMQDTLKATVVKAKAKPSPTLQAAPLQVMAKGDFDKLGIAELYEAIKTFSGVQIKDYGGIGGVKTVSIRSMGAQHTAVSYDGVTISNAQNGQIDIGRFNLDNVSMVSLCVGPSDDIFQTARMFASAGSLNIKTAIPVFEDKSVNVSATMKYASFDTYNPSFIYQQKLCSNWAFTANADWLKSNGEYPFTLVNGTVVTKEKRLNSDVNTFRAEANIFGDMGRGGKISFKGNYLNSQRGLPGSVVLYNTDARERLWDVNGFAQVHYENSFGQKWKIQGQLKYNYAWNKYRDEKEYYANGVQIDYYTQNEYYSSVSAMYKPLECLSISLSQDFFINDMSASLNNFVYPLRYSSLSALAAQYKNERLTASASLLSTYITETTNNNNPAPDRFRLSPAASVSYKLFEDYNFRVRASYQDVFRTPTFNDLYYAKIGNKNLKPEIARQFNLGFTWRSSFENSIADDLSIQVDGYYNTVKDKIVALPTLFIWKMMNMGKVSIWGTDVNVSTNATLPAGIRLELGGSYSYQYAVDITDKNAKNYKDQIPYTPRHSGSLTVSVLNKWANLGYVMSAVGSRYALPQNIKSNKIDAYCEHSISVSKAFDIYKCNLKIQAECQNVGNKQYDVIQYYPMPGRSYRLSVRLTY